MAYRSATKTCHSDSFGNVLPCGLHWKHQNERHVRHIVSNIRIHEDIWGYMGIQYGKDENEDTWNAGTTGTHTSHDELVIIKGVPCLHHCASQQP